jgi:hypothetical protein
MATSAQITGPKTTRHGLSAAFTVLTHEDQDEFDILLACLRDEFQPANQHELFLTEQMAQSRWRLARIQRLETALFDQMLGTGEFVPAAGRHDPDSDQRIAAKLLNGGDRALATLQRYAAAAERSYYKAHAELLKSRQLRNEAKTVEAIDAAVIGRLVKAPPPRIRNEPKFYTAPGEKLALRL